MPNDLQEKALRTNHVTTVLDQYQYECRESEMSIKFTDMVEKREEGVSYMTLFRLGIGFS